MFCRYSLRKLDQRSDSCIHKLLTELFLSAKSVKGGKSIVKFSGKLMC